MIENSQMKLGRKAIKWDSRRLMMRNYLTPALPPPPAAVDWTKGIASWGMMMNDTLGDCTIAGVGHAVQVWSANLGNEITLSDTAIQAAYELWDGYNPADPSTDQGGVEETVLDDWRQQGFAGHKLLAYADPEPTNLTDIRQSIWLFGGCYIGVALPLTAQTQDVWDVVPDDGSGSSEAGSWGGHCVFVPKYDMAYPYTLTCITWGQLKTMTVAFWRKYVDEAHTLFGQDWLAANGAPSGFNLEQLQADLNAIR
jgi:hypothetical protein